MQDESILKVLAMTMYKSMVILQYESLVDLVEIILLLKMDTGQTLLDLSVRPRTLA
jgi:hypothetical protein